MADRADWIEEAEEIVLRETRERLDRARDRDRVGNTGEPEPVGEIARLIARVAAANTGLTPEELARKAAEIDLEEASRAATPQVRELEARIMRRRMLEAGVPEEHVANLALSAQGIVAAPAECDALAKVRALYAEPPEGRTIVMLSGGLGVRKTGSACWLLGKGDGGVYVEADELLAVKIEDPKRYLKLKHAPLVVIDELGTEIPDEKGYWLKTFGVLFNSWYASRARVVMTSNLVADSEADSEKVPVGQRMVRKPPGFRQLYGSKVWSRFEQRGKWFDIGGESVR